MLQISKDQLEASLPFPELVNALEEGFRDGIETPPRQHYDILQPGAAGVSTLLLMPAWQVGKFTGVKIITVTPDNGRRDLPAVQGVYILFEAERGIPLAQFDAPMLTARRTAAASALASVFLSSEESRRLLMVGTGALAPHLIRAHAAVRPIDHVYVWGRRAERARAVADLTRTDTLHTEPVDSIEEVIREADIISCATLSPDPLIRGDWLRPGQHLDLVGSYRPEMREADDETVRRSRIFVDCRRMAPRESGDLAIPIRRRIVTIADIKADMYELCRGKAGGRKGPEEITMFKSVGLALEDLAAAKLAYLRLTSPENEYASLFD